MGGVSSPWCLEGFLKLIPRTRAEVRSTLAALEPAIRARISPDWWAKFDASADDDPWVHGFHLLLDDGTNVGIGSFKGPPVDGAVEIAYAILPQHQGLGHATAAARAMVEYAFRSKDVRRVRAHTRPDGAASQRVLLKAGFARVGQVVDPVDGVVWRFEIASSVAATS
jgi:RimJ/RimL family protein N-acetyltransferase